MAKAKRNRRQPARDVPQHAGRWLVPAGTACEISPPDTMNWRPYTTRKDVYAVYVMTFTTGELGFITEAKDYLLLVKPGLAVQL